MKNLTLLGGLSPHQFLNEYWQKKPLLIRQAISDFTPIADRESLFSLAGSDGVESRLITQERRRWAMRSGPFHVLPDPKIKSWSLLLQGMDLHLDEAHALLRQFRFIPDARLDDLMISYASDRGGVGPHFDSYDVFLLQAYGKRRWQISAQKDLSLVEGLPLKILKNFQPEQEYILEPGDMLYLPPQYAHNGVAIGECMTYSIGFRAPSYQEFAESFLQFMAETIELPGRFADKDLQETTRPGEIPTTMIETFSQQLEKIQFTREDILIHLGEYLSEPKNPSLFSLPERTLPRRRFIDQAGKKGVELARQTRMLYRGRHVFINADSFRVDAADQKLLAALANERCLGPDSIRAASSDLLDALHAWYEDGWLHLGR